MERLHSKSDRTRSIIHNEIGACLDTAAITVGPVGTGCMGLCGHQCLPDSRETAGTGIAEGQSAGPWPQLLKAFEERAIRTF